MVISKESKINLLDFPTEIRLLILRFTVPRDYPIQPSTLRAGYTRNPSLPLLLVDHAMNLDILSLSSLGTINAWDFHDARQWWYKATDTKRTNVSRVVVQASGNISISITTEEDRMEKLALGAKETYEFLSRRYDVCVVEKQEVRVSIERIIYYEVWMRVSGPLQELREVEGQQPELGNIVIPDNGTQN